MIEEFSAKEAKRVIIYVLNEKDYNLEVKLSQSDNDFYIFGLDDYNFNVLTELKEKTTMTFLITTDNGILLVRAQYRGDDVQHGIIFLRNVMIVKRIQRRDYARIPYIGDFTYTLLTRGTVTQNNKNVKNLVAKMTKKKTSSRKKIERSGHCINISMSGACLQVSENIHKDEIIAVTLNGLSTVDSLYLLGQVVHCKKTEFGYNIGVDFSINDDRIKDILAKEFLIIQRKYLQLIGRENEQN